MENYLSPVYGKTTFSPEGLEVFYTFLTEGNAGPKMKKEEAIITVYYVERQLTSIPCALAYVDNIARLYKWLMGQYYDARILEYVSKHQPKLTPKKALSVILFLQNQIGAIPEKFKLCSVCGEWFDASQEGSDDTCESCSAVICGLLKECDVACGSKEDI